MIFVTVGTQEPFDRLVRAVDAWAREAAVDGFAQVGRGGWRPERLASAERVAPDEFRRRLAEAELVVAHAGMGTILPALELGTPLLVMPRLARLGEHRSDHQVATARRFGERGLVRVADDERALRRALEELGPAALARRADRIGPTASPELLAAVRAFVEGA